MQIVTYAFDPENGTVLSRFTRHGNTVGFALPVLDFEAIGKGGVGDDGEEYPAGDFNGPIICRLEKFDRLDIGTWNRVKWTKKIPLNIKNEHRKFWGLENIK